MLGAGSAADTGFAPAGVLAGGGHGCSPLERRLDVVVLHEAVLRGILNISAQAVREQKNVRYYRSDAEAVQEVADGADATFLLNPVSVSTMRDLCYAGRVMPQKSTDFYPKLLSGLTLDDLDQCF